MHNEATAAAIDIASLAAALREAESTRVGIAPLTEQHPDLTLEAAYAIQRTGIEDRVARGERVVGRKIGLTSLAIQQQLGVDQPDYGAITDAMELADGAELDPALLLRPRIEAEFAFEIDHDLPQDPSYDEVVEAVSRVAVAMEVIDSRIVDWRIKLLDTVADNASMARVVWGRFVPATPELLAELPDSVVSLLRDGEEVCAGPGSAGAIGAQNDRLRAGDRVLAGAVAAAVDFTPGSSWSVHTAGLPAASLNSTPASLTQA
jgi:2-keto-4-pentenoate hydratase